MTRCIGHAGTRNPPRVNTLSTVDPAKPFGLKSVKVNFSSDAAKSFEFQKTG